MENRRENQMEKRKRKMVSRPVLVRSERPGKGVESASYERRSSIQLWRAA